MIEFLLLILRFATYVRSYGGNVFQTLFGGYKVYCIKNVLFYAVQSNYCIKIYSRTTLISTNIFRSRS